MKYQPFSKIYIFVVIALLVTAIRAAFIDGETDVRSSILVITIFTAVLQWLFLIVVAREITSILGISVFFTKQSDERRRAKREVRNSDNLDGQVSSGTDGLRDPLLIKNGFDIQGE